jgi:hypothetical protein
MDFYTNEVFPMPNNAMEDEKRQKGPRQLNLRVSKDDSERLEHLQTATGLANRSEVLRYALKYTSDHHPVPLPLNENVDPTLLRDIAGLSGLFRAFFNAATEHMDKESEVYRSFVARLLLIIGDPREIWSLFAENLPASMVVLHYTHATHLQYEVATELLVLNGVSLDERNLTEEGGGMRLGRRSYRLYLDDLLEIYTDRLKRYQGPGEFTNFVTRLRRYIQIILLPEKGQ